VREGADGDEINARLRNVADGRQRHAATGFELNVGGTQEHGFSHFCEGHIVEQDHIDMAERKKRADLIERVGFDLDGETGCLGGIDIGLEKRHIRASGKVIIFEHDHVVQAKAVIRATTGDDGRFFEEAESGRRFAGVEKRDARSGNRIDVSARHRGYAAKPLHKVQRRAFRRENRTGRAGDFEHDIAGRERFSINAQAGDHKRGINPNENFAPYFDAREAAGLTRHDPRRRAACRVRKMPHRHITRADVFSERQRDDIRERHVTRPCGGDYLRDTK